MDQHSLLAHEDKLYLNVVLKKEATILNCLPLSKCLKKNVLVEETYINLSPMATQEGCLFQTEHSLRVFLKKETGRQAGLELAEDLKT